MKILLLALQGALASASRIPYGPKNCVALDHSSEGTCVIRTNCVGIDTENFEFAFDCTTPKHEVQRHSFGFGGFDAQEEFDTSVKCTICEPPTDQHHVLVGTGSTKKTPYTVNTNANSVLASSGSIAMANKEKSAAESKKSTSETSKVVTYGPDECVSTYRNPSGHCMMQTNCAKENITEYEFGLICVDKTGEPVRHVFGKNSFDPEESFDTLIACDKCLGLDDMADETSLVKQVEKLTEEVEGMNSTLSTLRKDVKKLQGKVLPKKDKKVEFLLPHVASKKQPVSTSHRKPAKLHLKAAKKHSAHHARKIQKEEDDDADDDQDEDRAQDQDEDTEEDQDQDDQQQDDSEEDA